MHNFEAKTNITLWKWSTLWIGGKAKWPKEKVPFYYPKNGIFEAIDPDTGVTLMTKENERFFRSKNVVDSVPIDLCPTFQMTTNPDTEDPKIDWHDCGASHHFGRIFCEFSDFPSIHIKGLCKKSNLDRDFVLLDIKPHEGKSHCCSAWPRLKLNTKIGLHTTTHHPPPPNTIHHTNS